MVDALPMILVPQHFYLYNHYAIEQVLGPAEMERLLRPAGYKSAYFWCEKEAAFHGLSGEQVFWHYLKRLSQRGWAQFTVLSVEPDGARARVRVDHSIFVRESPPSAGRKVCYMFRGWFAGSLEWVGESCGKSCRLSVAEVQCAAEGAHDHCLFEVVPAGG